MNIAPIQQWIKGRNVVAASTAVMLAANASAIPGMLEFFGHDPRMRGLAKPPDPQRWVFLYRRHRQVIAAVSPILPVRFDLVAMGDVGRAFAADGFIVVRPMGLPVPQLVFGPGKTAAPAGWAACVYNLRTLGASYLFFTRGSGGCSVTTAPGGNGFLVAWPEASRGPERKESDLAKGRTVIAQFDPASGRVVLKRRFDWLIADSLGAGQVSLVTGPDGLVWLVRLAAVEARCPAAPLIYGRTQVQGPGGMYLRFSRARV